MTNNKPQKHTGKVFKATHRGYLKIGEVEIPCAVLEGGKRVISQTGLFKAFNRPRKGEVRQEGLPSVLGAKNLLDYVSEEVREKSITIPYYHTNGSIAYGYDAELIPLICEIYLRANDEGKIIHQSQSRLVIQANIIIRALAKIGITALIDEATGFQYDREQEALQQLLAKYILEDYLKWQARFPKKYYQEIFRLLGWEYNPLSAKRPSYLGKFTNKYVYELMPPKVLETLREKNPITQNGHRERRHHQFLTEDIGVPHLDKHLTKLITVMELSDSFEDFKRNFNRIFASNVQLVLTIDGDD